MLIFVRFVDDKWREGKLSGIVASESFFQLWRLTYGKVLLEVQIDGVVDGCYDRSLVLEASELHTKRRTAFRLQSG